MSTSLDEEEDESGEAGMSLRPCVARGETALLALWHSATSTVTSSSGRRRARRATRQEFAVLEGRRGST